MSDRTALRRRVRTTLLAGAGFLVLQLGWILSVAPHFGIDEFDHAYRASSVAAGHWAPGDQTIPTDLGRGDLIPVRADVAEAARAACAARPYTGIYNCQPMSTLPSGEVLIASGASRYNPLFYAAIGVPAAAFDGTANLYALRAVTALLGCLLFLMVIWLTVAGARTVWPLVAVLVAALPTTVYSTTVAAPNGLEMVAGLGAWVALLAVVAPRGQQTRRSAYLSLGVFAAVLANTHTLGLVWLALILVAVCVLHGPAATLRALLPRGRGEATVAVVTAAAGAFEVLWVVLSGVNNPTLDRTTFQGNPWEYVVQGLLLWPLQAVGAFPMRNDSAPALTYALIIGVLVALTVTALRRTGLRTRPVLTLGFVTVVSFAVPAYLTVRTFEQLGSAWQGRYGMPFTVGLIVLLGWLLDTPRTQTARTGTPRTRLVALGAVATVVAAQLISQWAVMTKQRSNFALVAETRWVPPSAALLLALGVVAVGCWVLAVEHADRRATDDQVPQPARPTRPADTTEPAVRPRIREGAHR